MKIFNTMSKTKEEFVPVDEKEVKIYACGPTVYNFIHIGNARPLCVFDVLRRYMEYKGYNVKFVQNFTDIDDKIINRANEEGLTFEEVSKKYIEEFWTDAHGLNFKDATIHPKATENIDEIIDIIKSLEKKGYAYAVNGDVYFRTLKFKEYGKLSHQPIDDLVSGARIAVGDIKENPLDFALWKGAKEGEPYWDSPWGKGRPGWHIECSVMSTKYLGDTIDIHGGGQDLEFPHHENEIAQSEAKTGKKFVNYWMHNGFVTVGKKQEKMSKSLHNFVTVHDILKQIDPQILRFYMSSVQYRRPINYSEDGLKQAETVLKRYQNTLRNLDARLNNENETLEDNGLRDDLTQAKAEFIEAMDDDFNVQNALSIMYDLATTLNNHLQKDQVDKPALKRAKKLLIAWLEIFGVSFKEEQAENDDEIEKLIAQRDEARKNKDWAESDRLRDELQAKGIVIEDTPQGTRWHRA